MIDMTAIILVNWNGADDTIACLESLRAVDTPHFVVIADNDSTDDSVERIQGWLDTHSGEGYVKDYSLLRLDANYGFAIGNNKAVAFAMQKNPEYCMLLNNDTEVEPDFLEKLLAYAGDNPDVRLLSPCICYHYDKGKVWFSGGKLGFGRRKNLFAGRPLDSVGKEPFVIDFISGCALFFDTSLLGGDGKLLYEGFFFGEEDYEFSLRMKNRGVKMCCVPSSLIYHKVGASQKNTNDSRGLGRAYMYYHNRLICNRLNSGWLSFNIICLLNFFTCIKYFRRYTGSWVTGMRIFSRLMRDVRRKDGFGYDDFRALMFDNTYFDFDVERDNR